MSLIRSAGQTFRSLSRCRPYIYPGSSSSNCISCSVRNFSDQHEVASREGEQEQQHPTSKPSGSTSQPKDNKDFFSLLLSDDVGPEPGLSALDELNPARGNLPRSRTKSFHGYDAFEVWRITLERVMNSFTLTQLEKMFTEAGVPKKLLEQYKGRRGARPLKSIRAKALMIHQFNMKDPELEAEREASNARRQQKLKSLEMPVSQIGLLLLVLRGQLEMQKLLQLHRVKLRPFRREGNQGFALLLQGSEQGIESVRQWVTFFCDNVQSISFPLSSFSVSDDTVRPLEDHQLRLISQLSSTIVSTDRDEALSVTIHSVDDGSLSVAQSLLVQSLHDARTSYRRQLYSYASPAIPSERLFSVPTFGFVSYIGPSPLPWLSDPGPTASLFRLTRQDITNADQRCFSAATQDSPDRPKLGSIKVSETFDPSRTVSTGNDTFAQLKEQLQIGEESSGSISYTAEFGHLLFNNHNQASSSRVLGLLLPPVPGTWPLEHGLEWLRGISRGESESSALPSFCSVLPTLAASLDAGMTPGSSSIYNLEEEAGVPVEERIERRNEYWAEYLRKIGIPIQVDVKNNLNDFVNLNRPQFTEHLVITYTGNKGDLVIQLQEILDEGGQSLTGLEFHDAKWVQKSIADVLVPEASVDIRLGVVKQESLSAEVLDEDEGLQRYLAEEKKGVVKEHDVEERPAELPPSVIVQGQKLFLISCKRTCRWEWNLYDTEEAPFEGKFVLERVAQDEAKDNTSSFRIEFAEKEGVVEEVATGAPGEGSDRAEEGLNDEKKIVEAGKEDGEVAEAEQINASPRTFTWSVMRPFVDVFLAKGHQPLRG